MDEMTDHDAIFQEMDLLQTELTGDLSHDETTRLIYATDASAYREKPIAVARPAHTEDIRHLVAFARKHSVALIPRTAGTSLAGQVVGNGIIVDVSKYMTRILELNQDESWVRVEPGVVPDELNAFLKPFGLFFGPETATSNRCMIGGMVGNNSCGAHSLVYGSTRDHTLEIRAILTDGSEVLFTPLSGEAFGAKCHGQSLENQIYRKTREILSDPDNQQEIRKEYPDPSIHRRNTGYALDIILETEPFTETREPFNMCKLLAGSEGTLAFTTEIKLNLVPRPPAETGLVCIHLNKLEEAFEANLIALNHRPGAVEMLDKTILDLTKDNIQQKKNRFFLEGDPAAILFVEFQRDSREEILEISAALERDMRNAGFGYLFPIVFGDDINRVWDLRKAGLGLLSNMKGDAKPVPLCEDTAVGVNELPSYMKDYRDILVKHGKECVYYAHIGSGELHIRPILNMKDPKDIDLFHTIGREMAHLVKKYRGSLSGEHGDGRLRGEFIPIVVGERNYDLLKEIKKTWDPMNIFNPGKIIDTPKMNTFLRYEPGQKTRAIETIFDFSESGGLLQAVERCNGSGDCRKSERIGGTMCPSYMASRDENKSTRARANLLREILTHASNPFDSKKMYEILDLCLSCKGCKSECPSNVDMAKVKAEFLQKYYDLNGIPLRTRVIAYIHRINRIGAVFPSLFNFLVKTGLFVNPVKKVLGFAQKRQIPTLYKITLKRWAKRELKSLNPDRSAKGTVHFFIDEFTNYNDTAIGIKAIKLLTRLGYTVHCPDCKVSGRAFISKGLLRAARIKAQKNVELLKDLVHENTPLIGIEPSAILSFRDEYPDLVGYDLRPAACRIAEHAFLLEEFLSRELDRGNIKKEQFTVDTKRILYHGHCQQKAIASTDAILRMLSLPENYSVTEVPSGCCGMAGSFGFEKEHYDLSMKVGELVLFPEIRKKQDGTLVSASGTSCRQQIRDGTGEQAHHPVEILYDALV